MYRNNRGRFVRKDYISLKDRIATVITVLSLTCMTGYAIGHSLPVDATSTKTPLASDYVTPSVSPSVAPSATPTNTPTPSPVTGTAHSRLVTVEAGSESDIINTFKNADIIHQIYQGESSYGRNDVCRLQGKYNGFGYAEPNPLKDGPTCFESFEEVVSHVDAWIQDKLDKGFSRSQMNCYYVRGLAVEHCNTAYKLQ